MQGTTRKMAYQHGFTLVELLIGTTIFLLGSGALLAGMNQAMIQSDYLAQYQVVLNASQGLLEEVTLTPFNTLWTGVQFGDARRTLAAAPMGQCVGMGEDRNCSGTLDAGEDLNGNGVLDDPLPGGRLAMQVHPFSPGDPNPSLLDVHIAACWNARGRVVGEDRNCNGVLDPGEDDNGNGWMDSPVMVSTRVARTD